MTSSANNAKVQPCILRRFDLLKKVGSGAYGHVWKVQDKSTKSIYALKKIFDAFQHSTDAQRTYREVSILKQLDHDNIIKLKETIKAENPKDIYLVFEFMEADLHNVINEGILKMVHNKYIVYQIAKALLYMKSAKLIHRDLKPSNILLNSACHAKVCDFGLVRCVGGTEDANAAVMTEGVATRWYRAPEVLLGSKSYEYPADVWSFGCIIYETFFRKPLFNGNSTLDQLQKILEFTGIPSAEDLASLESDLAKTMISEANPKHKHQQYLNSLFREAEPDLKNLLLRMLHFNPKKRITIQQILAHPLVKDFRKIEEEKICEVEIKTSLDDNKKLTVDNYRNVLYNKCRSESKVGSTPSRKTLNSSSGTLLNQVKSDKKPSVPNATVASSMTSSVKSTDNLNKLTKPTIANVKTVKSTSFLKPAIQQAGSPKQQQQQQAPSANPATSTTNISKQLTTSTGAGFGHGPRQRSSLKPLQPKSLLNSSSKQLVGASKLSSPTAQTCVSNFSTVNNSNNMIKSTASPTSTATVSQFLTKSITYMPAKKKPIEKENGPTAITSTASITSPKAKPANNIISPKYIAARKISLNSPTNPLK